MVLDTDRLHLRHFMPEDAEFILQLVNEPSWIENIGDKRIRNTEDAARYIREGLMSSYLRYGYGLYLVELKEGHVPIGMCGLVNREGLDHVDIGFAFLTGFTGMGFAHESAKGILEHAQNTLGLDPVLGITIEKNQRSIRLLERLGLAYMGPVQLSENGEKLMLFSTTPASN